MRVLIHALAAREHGGTERHLRAFLPALAQVCPDDDYILYTDPVFDPEGVYPNVRVERVSARSFWQRLWWDHVVLPRLAASEKVDVFWALLSFGAIRPPVPQVMFQRNAMYYCDYYVSLTRGAGRHILHLRRWLLWLVMRASARIVVPTAAMRTLVRVVHSDIPLDRFTVIPHAFDPKELAGTEALPAIAQRVLAECGSDTLKILYVGHILPYKQLDVLLEACQRVRGTTSRSVRLLLTIACEDWPSGYDVFVRQVKTRSLEQSVKILGKIPQLAIGHLYHACDVVAFPSLCESFGWPLVEATSLGIPVLAADTPVNHEMAGEGALYFALRDVESAATQLHRLLGDERLRSTVGAAGRAHFERTHLTWPEYVQRCLEATFGSKPLAKPSPGPIG